MFADDGETMSSTISIGIHGAAGRMGQRLVALAAADDQLEVAAALESGQHPRLGEDAGQVAGGKPLGVPLAAELTSPVAVMIDFSVPAALNGVVELCTAESIPLVVATTGLDAEQQQLLQKTAETIPLVWAPNMSMAVNLTMQLTGLAAKVLGGVASGVDAEVIDRHHRYKEDSPSGTALKFGQIIAEGMGQTEHVHGREGILGPRSQAEIGYHALRVGDNPGEHTIVFGMLGETIELTVRATNRDCYALGALAAAKYLADKDPGLYAMNDVLGL